MNRTTAVLGAVAMLLDGCAYHRLVTREENPGSTQYVPVESSAIGWGAVEQKSVAEQCETNLLAEVRVRTSLLHSLATVLTLGFWQPARVEYRCAKEPTGIGEIPE